MAEKISINTSGAKAIYDYAKRETADLRDRLSKLDAHINSLRDAGAGNWYGDAADRFFADYESVKSDIKDKMPATLDNLADNLDRNLRNLVEADGAGI